MRIQEILIESHQLDEGPILNKIGSAVGKGVGTLAKGVGAVAGGVAGIGSAVKKGFQAGKATVGGAGDDPAAAPAAGGAQVTPAGATTAGGIVQPPPSPAAKPKGFLAGVKAGQARGISALTDPAADEEDPAAPAGGAAAPAPAAGATTPPSATDINKAGPKGTAQAKPIQGTAAKQAVAKTGAALAGQDQAQAGQTMYTQVKANIDKLDKKGKQRILQLLQKSMAAPAGAAGAAPAAGGAMGAMAGQLAKGGAAPNTMANAPVSKTNTAKPGNPNAAPAAGAAPAAEPAAPAPSGEKTIANPVATVGTKRASNIGQPTFDTQTGKSLPGQALNNVRKKAEYGTNALGAARKKIKAGAAQPEMASKINTGSMVLEGFSLFRKK